MFVFTVLLVITCLVGCKARAVGVYEDYLSPDNTNAVRGICALLIVFHHITLTLTAGASSVGIENVTVDAFKGIGFLIVAVFFFFTGYGLAYSSEHKKDYAKGIGFMKGKFIKILIPYAVVNVIYFITKIFYTKRTLASIIEDLKTGHPIADNSWYVVAVMVVYFAFWIAYQYKNKYIRFVCFLITLSLYSEVCIAIDFPDWWYKTLIIVPMGMVWYNYNDRIVKFFKKNTLAYFGIFAGLLAAFILLYNCETLFGIKFGDNLKAFVQTVVAVIFTALVVMLLMKVTFNNYTLRWVGGVSFELYMIHGLFIRIFKKSHQITLHTTVYVGIVIACSVIAAYLLYRMFNEDKVKMLGKQRGAVVKK